LTATALALRLGGLAFAAGIPGSVGGAVAMNAGAYGHEMKEIVLETECVDETGEHTECLRGTQAHGFTYRSSHILTQRLVALRTVFALAPASPDEICREMNDYLDRRRKTQPLSYPSAGSIFRRPPGDFAGRLIESCGLKGYRIGDAQVSEKHAGFIINRNRATTAEILALIRHVQQVVSRETGTSLDLEVRIAGEE
jgi:UDP-N-acetylmuramate dehydrogenase